MFSQLSSEKLGEGPSAAHWQRLTTERRSGVVVPLYSLHSRRSAGLGEIPDLTYLIDWCHETGQTLLQLLPLNDMGGDVAPYSAKSNFALDPLYLCVEELIDVPSVVRKKSSHEIRRKFPIGERVNYRVKEEKIRLLKLIFEKFGQTGDPRWAKFRHEAGYWLRDDALFKILKDKYQGRAWEEWPQNYRERDPASLERLEKEEKFDFGFHQWVQWQLHEQFCRVKEHAQAKGVLLVGDMPFLVARDSADVWANRSYFKMDASAGAPPDLYFAGGQRWGMPPYHWPAMAEKGYDYLVQKLKTAEAYYDLFRIDHVIGVFRLFSISLSTPMERMGLEGQFDPVDVGRWEEHGRELLSVMLKATRMLPCGEDLGVVPDCSYKVLAEMGIPGLNIQRWLRDWGKSNQFVPPDLYRLNSVVMLSTHDTSPFSAWWRDEAGTIDGEYFRLQCEAGGADSEKCGERLFDKERSGYGRRRWRTEIKTDEDFLTGMGLPAEKVYPLLESFRSTRSEQEIYGAYLGYSSTPPKDVSPELVERALVKALSARSIFSLQLLQDWLSLTEVYRPYDPWETRINTPGLVSEKNWSFVCPLRCEDFESLPVNGKIRSIHEQTNRGGKK